MKYEGNDIEFAQLILTDRKSLEDREVNAWMEDPEHLNLLKELAAFYKIHERADFHLDKKKEFSRLQRDVRKLERKRMMLRWSVAASITLLVSLFLGYMAYEWRDDRQLVNVSHEMPYAKAELVLSTGERIQLEQKDENIASALEAGIRNDSIGRLDYTVARVNGNEVLYNTIYIPREGFYQLTLSDGSKVWLNSMTEFHYPVTFTGAQRKVRLIGEAYFEVTHDSEHPFIVETRDGMEVKVYGTEFNMNTYQEGVVKTVLVKGIVGVRKNASEEVMLAPNQMATYDIETGKIQIENVDSYRYTAWKEGEFVFERETIEEIMERLAMWYDVKVFYSNELLKQKRFTGVVSRSMSIEQILHLIEGPATLRFEIKNNVVTIKER